MVVRDGQDVRFVSFRVVSNLVWWSFFVAWVIFMVIEVCMLVARGSELRCR
jgi:hypothetical protein